MQYCHEINVPIFASLASLSLSHDLCCNRWLLTASRGWELTTSRSRRVSRDRPHTSALPSRRLRARPRAPTCSPAHRRNRYETSADAFLTSRFRLSQFLSQAVNPSAPSRSEKNRKKKKSLFSCVCWQLLTALFCRRRVLEKRSSGFPPPSSFFFFFFFFPLKKEMHPFRRIDDTHQT